MPEFTPWQEGPQWFLDALAVPYTDEFVVVDGARIHYLRWGEPGAPGLIFVHGGGAQAHWWTHIAAQFAGRYRVAAIDLSGHGDSDRRSEYSLVGWTSEVVAVAQDMVADGPPVVIGHSMGGFVSIATASRHADALAGVIVVDSPVTRPDPELDAARGGQAFGKPRVYPDVETAISHFRTVPEQANYEPWIMDRVARMSLAEVDGGVSWKFDRNFFLARTDRPRAAVRPELEAIRIRFALLASEFGLVTPDVGAYMYELLGRVAPIVELPQAGHHPMLDVPLVLLTAIRTLLADWDHSTPLPRH